MQEDKIRMQQDILNPIALTENNNVNNLYYHQAMKAQNEN